MGPKRRQAIRGERGSTVAPGHHHHNQHQPHADPYDGVELHRLVERDGFRAEVALEALRAVANRLATPLQRHRDADLREHVRRITRVTDVRHREAVERARDTALSRECRLRVTVVRAEKLAAKDVDGTSDPYCILSVVKGTAFEPMHKSDYKVSLAS